MTEHDAIIVLYAYIKDNKAAESIKIHSLWCGEEEQRAWQHQTLSRKWTLSLMSYKKHHQSRSREGNEGLQTLYEKNGSWFSNGSKINEDSCKNWSQAFSFEAKEESASYCPSTTKESWSFLEFAEIWHVEGWNRFFFLTKKYSLWRQSLIQKTTECWPNTQRRFLKTC